MCSASVQESYVLCLDFDCEKRAGITTGPAASCGTSVLGTSGMFASLLVPAIIVFRRWREHWKDSIA
jgi:hypothetical protein